jgi:hypothetical protein
MDFPGLHLYSTLLFKDAVLLCAAGAGLLEQLCVPERGE